MPALPMIWRLEVNRQHSFDTIAHYRPERHLLLEAQHRSGNRYLPHMSLFYCMPDIHPHGYPISRWFVGHMTQSIQTVCTA